MYVPDNIEKILLKNGDKSPINNYGVYNYFNFSDHIQDSKMVATLIDDKYIITYGNAEECYHYDLRYAITNEFGKFHFIIIAYANDLLIWTEEDNEYSDDEIDVIIRIIDEVEKYIYDTGIVKDVNISCSHIDLCSYGNNLNSYGELKKKLESLKSKKTKPITK